jgi:hypothetical protein
VARPSEAPQARRGTQFNVRVRSKIPTPVGSLQTRNEKTSSRITLCAPRRSHLYRVKFIPQLFVNQRSIVSQIPAMPLVLS